MLGHLLLLLYHSSLKGLCNCHLWWPRELTYYRWPPGTFCGIEIMFMPPWLVLSLIKAAGHSIYHRIIHWSSHLETEEQLLISYYRKFLLKMPKYIIFLLSMNLVFLSKLSKFIIITVKVALWWRKIVLRLQVVCFQNNDSVDDGLNKLSLNHKF